MFFRMYKKSAKLCQMCKSVQNVQTCSKCANMCKSVQNVQKCAKCAKYAKLCKMCKADRANRANSAHSDTNVENGITYLGKPHWESCRVYSGIAQIAIAPPALHSNGHSGALYFRADLSKCHLNFNFHCISAPNHPGKGSDPPKIRKCPFEHGQFFSK